MTLTSRKKLNAVALPLEDINRAPAQANAT